MTRLTFEKLCQLSADVRRLRDEARLIARTCPVNWYLEWIGHGEPIMVAVRTLAERERLKREEVAAVVRAGLAETYTVTRQRINRPAAALDTSASAPTLSAMSAGLIQR